MQGSGWGAAQQLRVFLDLDWPRQYQSAQGSCHLRCPRQQAAWLAVCGPGDPGTGCLKCSETGLQAAITL